ncbi:hypothetical protein L4D06_01040 [Enterovibrio makurazakiensis]|uniref:hypothetical protein n=1 Tax=Enterovibrio makurazakiensis TaxID=2910232 RepID=UPI003D1A15EE
MYKWLKKGLIYNPQSSAYTHGSHPCIVQVEGDLYVIAYTCRDKNRKSNIFLSYANVSDGIITLVGSPKMALSPGDIGYFDCDGVISGCLIKHEGGYYLYFVGWQNLPDGLWICDTGRATLDIDKLELTREFPGPIIGRDKNHPLFAAATAFHISEDGIWHTWYNSGLKWERTDKGLDHYYGLHHAHSVDGIDWIYDKEQCLPFKDEYEYAFGRPSVVFWAGKYHMWYAHRASKYIETYRIGYSTSNDGLSWDRQDESSGIDVSESGWDSQMICYPSVFEHEGIRYMLYNGNHYGLTGFGYAVMEGNVAG